MKKAMVYFQEQDGLDTTTILKNIKQDLQKENWEYLGLIMDDMHQYNGLFHLITKEFESIDILYIYSKNNIPDPFYWELLLESAKAENVSVKEWH